MDVSSFETSSVTANYASTAPTEETTIAEGKLGANEIKAQPEDPKTQKVIRRIQANNEKMQHALSSNALATAGEKVRENITLTRIRNGFTPVSEGYAEESSYITALRESILSSS